MPNIFERAYTSLFKVVERKDLSQWGHLPSKEQPIYGLYHVFCDEGWELMVKEQMVHLKASGLMNATDRFFVSCIVKDDSNIEHLQSLIDSTKMNLISVSYSPTSYEFPALDYIYKRCQQEDFLFYYFHTKGISYQYINTTDREFCKFRRNIVSWRKMMEYFLFDKWMVAVNVLQENYDAYGCYLFPPFIKSMYAGNFWWTKSTYFRTLPQLTDDVRIHNRFMAEEWLLSKNHRAFSAFDTVADLYTVNMPREIYAGEKTPMLLMIRFFCQYTFRKYQSKWFGYNWKHHCQHRFQVLRKRFNPQ